MALAHGTRVPVASLFVRLITPAEDETPINEFHSIFLPLQPVYVDRKIPSACSSLSCSTI